MFWISTRMLAEDAIRLAGKLPANIAGVAGVPRSGMLAATILAAHLHLPLYELPAYLTAPRMLGFGERAQSFNFENQSGPLAIVDDAAWSGRTLKLLIDRMARGRTQGIFACVYATDDTVGLLDACVQVIPCEPPPLFEWAIFNAQALETIALDLDGVICHDPISPDADEGPGLERYAQWLDNAPPLHLPRTVPCPLIVTARLERWREPTEAWLRKWRVRWGKLIMHPAEKASERGDVAAWKARHFRESGCKLMIESDPGQAESISLLSGKPVVCPALSRVFHPR